MTTENTVVEIPLTQGKSAIVDSEDAEYLMQFKWSAVRIRHTWYATRHDHGYSIYMHRQIMFRYDNEFEKSGLQVDHINRDGLDNRKSNLRQATRQLQALNSSRKSGETGYRGVKRNRKYSFIAQITIRGKNHYLGSYKTPEEAARAYDEAAREAHGEHANTNF